MCNIPGCITWILQDRAELYFSDPHQTDTRTHTMVLGYSSLFPVGSKSVSTRPGMYSFFLSFPVYVCVQLQRMLDRSIYLRIYLFSFLSPMRAWILIVLKTRMHPVSPTSDSCMQECSCIVVLCSANAKTSCLHTMTWKPWLESILWHIKQVCALHLHTGIRHINL